MTRFLDGTQIPSVKVGGILNILNQLEELDVFSVRSFFGGNGP